MWRAGLYLVVMLVVGVTCGNLLAVGILKAARSQLTHGCHKL